MFGMLIQRVRPAASYTLLDGYTFRADPACTSRRGPPSLREVGGLLGPPTTQEKWKIGGIKRASRPHNLPPIPA